MEKLKIFDIYQRTENSHLHIQISFIIRQGADGAFQSEAEDLDAVADFQLLGRNGLLRAFLFDGQFLVRFFDFFSQTASLSFQLTVKAGVGGELVDLFNGLVRGFFCFSEDSLGFFCGVSNKLFFSLVQPLFLLGKPRF